MPREKEGFRDQLESLVQRFPGREAIGISDCVDILGFDRRVLLADRTFPARKIGGKYMVPLVALARWLC